MKLKVNRWIENLPWWWVLIPLSPVLIFIFLTVRESSAYLDVHPTESVHLTDGVAVVFEVAGIEYGITDQTVSPETIPEGCILIPHSKILSNAAYYFLSCGGENLGSVMCVLDCTLTSSKIVRIER